MAPESRELAQQWFGKALADFALADLLINRERRLLDVAVFHCQQAAEKSLKGWLTDREIPFPKTRSLLKLVDLCSQASPEFVKFRGHAVELTPFVSAYRYPGDASQPDAALAAHAFRLAGEIHDFCQQQSE
jgi:HEPN domain-containing protein